MCVRVCVHLFYIFKIVYSLNINFNYFLYYFKLNALFVCTPHFFKYVSILVPVPPVASVCVFASCNIVL